MQILFFTSWTLDNRYFSKALLSEQCLPKENISPLWIITHASPPPVNTWTSLCPKRSRILNNFPWLPKYCLSQILEDLPCRKESSLEKCIGRMNSKLIHNIFGRAKVSLTVKSLRGFHSYSLSMCRDYNSVFFCVEI